MQFALHYHHNYGVTRDGGDQKVSFKGRNFEKRNEGMINQKKKLKFKPHNNKTKIFKLLNHLK